MTEPTTATPTTTDPDAAPSLVVAEVFGPTVQGEGPSLGRRCSFVRLGGCNLRCVWCDSGYTWDADRFDLRAELTRTPVPDILTRVLDGHPDMVVVTGGEPLLHQHQPAWRALLDGLATAGAEIEIETNGTLAPTPYTADRVTRFNVSPKLAHAGDPEAIRIRPAALAALRRTGRASFKFVCRTTADIAEVAAYTTAHDIPPRSVWVMPEGVTNDDLTAHLRVLAEPAITAGFNLTTRLHITLWGDERAR